MKGDQLVFSIQKWNRSTQIDAFVSIYNTNDERKLAKRMVGMFSDHEIERFIELLESEMKAERNKAARRLKKSLKS